MKPLSVPIPPNRVGRLRRDTDCGACGHAFARHVATLASPEDGGYPCAVFGCGCVNYRAPDHGTRTLLASTESP